MPTNEQTLNYNELETFFRGYRLNELQDVAFTASPGVDLLIASGLNTRRDFRSTAQKLKFKGKRLAQKGRIITGSLSYESPTLLTKLSGVVKSSGAGVNSIDNSPVDDTTVARWDLSEYYQPVGISSGKWRAAMSNGSTQSKAGAALSLIGQKTKSMYQTLIEEVAQDLYGTNTSAGSGILSLSAGIGNASPDTTTYGQISRSTYNVWRGNYTSRTDGNEDDMSDSDYILRAMQSDVLTVLANGAREQSLVFLMPGDLYTALWDAYMGMHDTTGPSLNGRFQLNDGQGIPDFAGQGLAFGNIPVVYDPNIADGKMFLIDTDTTYFVGLKGSIFDMEEWNLSENTTSHFSRLVFYGQLVVTNPRRNAISVYA